ncbi:ScbA/BarX family gamma-butyrolactone biosynthesis protein [Kutzneria sp. CA-103260]|uniref:ScbA/BarX family gamma-butyrolactone biosynthesis protein n=1 Tax=Kutzneria sp. CA-103260 TaxID=2802641 RepID=UPI001BAE33FA|nr:ScbA/BarX family gamma-butyrolactone biosynthesis protein [Kutzneria sp. CA-103260]QUQ64108.1 gamma-butyrolactone biosynthesis protein [Kutzneria sp. CA-103260]
MHQLTFSRTVPRELVHRSSVAEVFVTSLVEHGGQIEVGVQLPRSHAFFGDTDHGHHDPLAFTEAARQACLAVAHQCFDVPAEARFVLRGFELRVLDPAGIAIGDTPCDAVLHCHVVRRFTRDSRLHGLQLRHRAEIGGRHVLTADFAFSWLPENEWAAIRGTIEPAPAARPQPRCAASVVGRACARNVVIGPPHVEGSFARAAVVVDTSHPTLFDHALDHTPGMVLVEASRQLATACASVSANLSAGLVTGLRCRFTEFTELGAETTCHCQLGSVQPAGAGREVHAWCWLNQSGRSVAEAQLRLSFPDTAVAGPHVDCQAERTC